LANQGAKQTPFVGIKYSIRDSIYDVNNCADPRNWNMGHKV